MTRMRWDPFREFLTLQQRALRSGGDQDAEATWTPPVDIFEKGEDLVIRAELPGIDREAIEVRVENDTLTLSGSRERDESIEDAHVYRLERVHGSFARSFRLPKTVDAARIEAEFKNGVLQVRLPKAADARPRKVEIQAA